MLCGGRVCCLLWVEPWPPALGLRGCVSRSSKGPPGKDGVSQQRALDSGAGRGKTAGRFLPVAGARWTLWDGLRGGAFPKMVREAVLLTGARKRLLDMHGDRGICFLLWGEPGPIHCGGGRRTALGLEFSASWAIFRQAGQFLASRTSFRAS